MTVEMNPIFRVIYSYIIQQTQSVRVIPPTCAPTVCGVVIVMGETPRCQDPEPDIVNHNT